jgi:hypothetical protein
MTGISCTQALQVSIGRDQTLQVSLSCSRIGRPLALILRIPNAALHWTLLHVPTAVGLKKIQDIQIVTSNPDRFRAGPPQQSQCGTLHMQSGNESPTPCEYERRMTEELLGQMMQHMRKVPFHLSKWAADHSVDVGRTDALACSAVG